MKHVCYTGVLCRRTCREIRVGKRFLAFSAAAVESSNWNCPSDFTFIPDFLSLREQSLLLGAALKKLDSADSRQFRRRRRSLDLERQQPTPGSENSIQEVFLPDAYYQFQEGHYDGVIRNYRETHITSWPVSEVEGLACVLKRLYSLTPSQDTQTHLLHLASDGEIHPHVDNVSASGSWILGVSLGASRLLHMKKIGGSRDDADVFDVLLPSGSVYIQKNSLRYDYEHSILKGGTFRGHTIEGGQRLSIMVRDRLRPATA